MPIDDNKIAARLKNILTEALEQVPSGTLLTLKRTRVGCHFPAMQPANDAVYNAPDIDEEIGDRDKGLFFVPISAKPRTNFARSRNLYRLYLRTPVSLGYPCNPSAGAVSPSFSRFFPYAEAFTP